MIDLVKKNLLIGLGIVSMTQSKLKELGKKLADESKMSEKEGKKFVDEFMKQAEETKGNIETQVSKVVEKTVKNLKFPCTSGFEKIGKDMKKLNETLARIEEKLSKK